MHRKFIFSFMLFLCLTIVLPAQISRVMYFMDIPQNRIINPALRPSDSLYIGLPVLSGTGISAGNNFINFSDIVIKGRSDSLISVLHPDYDTDKFLSKIRRNNFAGAELMIQLFGLGFNAGKNYIFFDVNERIHANINIPEEVFELAFKGNEQYAGKYIDLSPMHSSFRYYREFGLGFSRNITPALRAGARIKFLYGMAGGAVRNNSLGIRIEQDYAHTVNADLSARFSAPVTIVQDENGRIHPPDIDEGEMLESVLMRNGSMNPGFAFDIGMTYQVSDRISGSAALTDLGFIRWKRDNSALILKDKFEFTGIDLTDVINGTRTIEEAGNEISDSLDNYIVVSEGYDPFSSFLPAGFSIAGSYMISGKIRLGLLSHSRFEGSQLRESLTLSANLKLGNSLSSTLSYTAANHRLDNFGAGLAFRLGILQFYILTDRVPLRWNKIVFGSSGETGNGKNAIFVPENMSMADMRLGINLVFGHRRQAKAEECEVVY